MSGLGISPPPQTRQRPRRSASIQELADLEERDRAEKKAVLSPSGSRKFVPDFPDTDSRPNAPRTKSSGSASSKTSSKSKGQAKAPFESSGSSSDDSSDDEEENPFKEIPAFNPDVPHPVHNDRHSNPFEPSDDEEDESERKDTVPSSVGGNHGSKKSSKKDKPLARRSSMTKSKTTASIVATPSPAPSGGARPPPGPAPTKDPSPPAEPPPTGIPRSQSAVLVKRLDALAVMKAGTPFLKYGKRGYPHFRQVQLVAGNRILQWYSKKKKVHDSQIYLRTVDEVVLGQTTANFHRIKAPELTGSSFSIIYDNRSKTLDLVAKDPTEYRLWTQGLSQLVAEIREDRPVEKLQALMVEVNDMPEFQKPSTPDSTGDDGDAFGLRRSPSTGGDKAKAKPLKQRYDALKNKYDKHWATIRSDPDFARVAHYEDITGKLNKLTGEFNEVSIMLRDGDYDAAEEDLWKMSIELESLTSMIHAASKHI